MQEQVIYDSAIYRVVHGSRAYGTHRPDSDFDEKGVCILSDPRYYYGFQNFHQKDGEWEDGNDRVIFDIRKFFKLALECNPNIIEVLFVDESDIIQIDDLGKKLRANRDLFLSRKAARTFVGYAVSQLHRIQGHYKWLQDPPEQPNEEDFRHEHVLEAETSTPWEREFDNHVIRVHQPRPSREQPGRGPTVRIEHYDKHSFKTAKKKFRQYNEWREKRNPDRAKIEAEFGFDLKHGYHLIRLLRMGKEILGDGKVLVKRPDAQELLDIRNGKYTYPELLEMAGELKEEVNQAVDASPLPEKPDFDKAEKLLMDLVKQRLAL
jgi:predicted nucleotidyltransferase